MSLFVLLPLRICRREHTRAGVGECAVDDACHFRNKNRKAGGKLLRNPARQRMSRHPYRRRLSRRKPPCWRISQRHYRQVRRKINQHRPTPNVAASWNVAPTDPLPVVRYDAKAGERSLDVLRWGLVPYWAKDIKVGFANINAKAEGIETKPAFREAFQRRRCLVPVDNFYEWKKTAIGKQPYAIALADGGLMALVGLWEDWRSPAGEWDTELRDSHYHTKRPLRAVAQSNAGRPRT
jgi:hypothetical protein